MRGRRDRARRRGLRAPAFGALLVFLHVVAGPASAHPTEQELADRARAAAHCTRAANPDAWSDAVHLGMGEAELRQVWGDALTAAPIERQAPDFQRGLVPPDEAAVDPYADQLRLQWRPRESVVQRVEYELFRGSVYRIRWQLGDRFEVPILDDLVHQASHCYGPPMYDQTIEAKLGSGEVTRRRTGWERGGQLLEVRQLNPLAGGPVFVTVTELAASQKVIDARGSLAPEPQRRAEPWWQRGGGPPTAPSDEARSELVRAFAAALSQTDFQRALEPAPAAEGLAH